MLGRLGESSRSLGAHCVGCPMVQGTHPIRSILECLVAKVLMHASVNDAPLSLFDGCMIYWVDTYDLGRHLVWFVLSGYRTLRLLRRM